MAQPFESEIDNILLLFKENKPYTSILDLHINIDSEIKSKIDFFIFYQHENLVTEAYAYFEIYFKNNNDEFFYYQKWYVIVKMLLLFVNKDEEQAFINGKNYNDKEKIDKLKKGRSPRYKHIGAWITNEQNIFNQNIVKLIEWIKLKDLRDEKYVTHIDDLTMFNPIDQSTLADDISKMIVHHLALNFELFFDLHEIPEVNIKKFSTELKAFLNENDQIDSTEADFFEHIVETSKKVYLGIKTDISIIQYKIIWDKLETIRKILNERLLYSEKLKNEHENNLQQKNDDMQKVIDALKKTNNEDNMKIADLESRLLSFRQEIEKLKEQLKSDKDTIKELKMKITYLEQMIFNLQKSVKLTKKLIKHNLYFDKLQDDSTNEEEKNDTNDDGQEEEKDNSTPRRDSNDSQDTDIEKRINDEMSKINPSHDISSIDVNRIDSYNLRVLYSSVLINQKIYIINGKGYYIDESQSLVLYTDQAFLRDTKYIRIFHTHKSMYNNVNDCIIYQNYTVNQVLFCCPDDKFRYIDDKKEFKELSEEKNDSSLYMNIKTTQIYIINTFTQGLEDADDKSRPVEDNNLIINHENFLYYTHNNGAFEVSLANQKESSFETKSKRKIKIDATNNRNPPIYLIQGFPFFKMHVATGKIMFRHNFGAESYRIYPALQLQFSQDIANGNLYCILPIDSDQRVPTNIMLNVNEDVWCEYQRKKYTVKLGVEKDKGLQGIYIEIKNGKKFLYSEQQRNMLSRNLSPLKHQSINNILSVSDLRKLSSSKYISPERPKINKKSTTIVSPENNLSRNLFTKKEEEKKDDEDAIIAIPKSESSGFDSSRSSLSEKQDIATPDQSRKSSDSSFENPYEEEFPISPWKGR